MDHRERQAAKNNTAGIVPRLFSAQHLRGGSQVKTPDDALWKSARGFRSGNRHVPKAYRIDPEFNCLTNAENLAAMAKSLVYVEGWCKMRGDKKWGAHAWCQTRKGEIVDPYFEWRFGDRYPLLEYRAAAGEDRPFD